MSVRKVSGANALKAQRLKKIIHQYALDHNMPLTELSTEIGLHRTSLSQMIHNKTNITPRTIEIIARHLKIDPMEIDPGFRNEHQQAHTQLPIIGTLTNKMADANLCRLLLQSPKPGLVAVINDLEAKDGEKPGIIVLDLETLPLSGDPIIYRRRDNPHFYRGTLLTWIHDRIIIEKNDKQILDLHPVKLAWLAKIHAFHCADNP